MTAANAKMRRLAVFYCIVLVVFVPRAAYAGFLTYATSVPDFSDCGGICNECQPLPVILDEWNFLHPEIPAIFYAFSSAMLTVVSVWFILTADEKLLLRTGRFSPGQPALLHCLAPTLDFTLNKELRLNSSLI